MKHTILSHKLKQIGILPVVTAHDVADTVELAKTLAASGIPCIEITCRTACALDAIQAVKDSKIDILLGAGTVTNAPLLNTVAEIGVDFAVSPGATPSLLQQSLDRNLLLLPGVSTASEVMLCMEYGLHYLKIFPAVPIHAAQLLKAFSAVFPDTQFCPTGGVNMNNLPDFIRLPNVFCVGGSWMVATELIQNKQWETISQLSKECVDRLAMLGNH